MSKTDNWYKFYAPYILIQEIFDINKVAENYIKKNYASLIVEQFEQYKEVGKYKRSGIFIEKEIKSGLKNPDAFYSEIKRGVEKDIADILPNLRKLPIVETYISDLEHCKYDKARVLLKDTLKLGQVFLNHPECCDYLLWLFSTTEDDSEEFQYGSNYLNAVSYKIKNTFDSFTKKNDSNYDISLACYAKYFEVDNFRTKQNIIDLYIQQHYAEILKDEYKFYQGEYKSNQDTFMRDMGLYEGEDDGRFLYSALIKKKKKMDGKLLEKFRDFEVLKNDGDSFHSKKLEELNHIRLALQFGALAFQKFPYPTTTTIMEVMEKVKSSGYGLLYLNELSEELAKAAYKHYKEEESIKHDIQMEKFYSDNMSNEEYAEARLLGFNV